MMIQNTCANEADLRWELGRLRQERHDIDTKLRQTQIQLRILRQQREANRQQMRHLEQQLALPHSQAEEVCLTLQPSEAATTIVGGRLLWPLVAVAIATWLLVFTL